MFSCMLHETNNLASVQNDISNERFSSLRPRYLLLSRETPYRGYNELRVLWWKLSDANDSKRNDRNPYLRLMAMLEVRYETGKKT